MGSVGGCKDHHVFLLFGLVLGFIGTGTAGGSDSVHLNKEFGLDSATGLVFSAASGTGNGVDFVEENGAGGVEPGHFEEDPHELFGLTLPFGSLKFVKIKGRLPKPKLGC